MKRTMNTTTRKDFRATLTEDEAMKSDGSAAIHWNNEETPPAEVW